MASELLLGNPSRVSLDHLAKSKMKKVNCWEISKVSDAGLFIDRRDYHRAWCAASESAERQIVLSSRQFDGNVRLLRVDSGSDALFPKGIHGLTNFLSRGIE